MRGAESAAGGITEFMAEEEEYEGADGRRGGGRRWGGGYDD